ncbi:hypothetical protein [Rhizobium rhizogenes]|uniref:Uncharacterized protein n=1 Tax=Rhizobium rhizogenes TaxID=359 RepID=A0AA92C5A0_RHIRH|nr:hypothetical protein [Rhizobium rhizogenes]PVE56337.1 hypothetical protein DC430_00600 [Rhizobium rhizogenes]PVE64832.1 hypothetical protein DC415_13800 [Agrobacterium tumefaciens]PVE73970.1 hypothetical protein DCP16_13800 [Sphingomonas sp. TPD3009]
MDEEDTATRFMAAVDEVLRIAPAGLQPTGAALIVAVHIGLGSDSRSLSNKLGIAHALVLREISALSGTLLHIIRREARTQRTFVELTEMAKALATTASKASSLSSETS